MSFKRKTYTAVDKLFNQNSNMIFLVHWLISVIKSFWNDSILIHKWPRSDFVWITNRLMFMQNSYLERCIALYWQSVTLQVKVERKKNNDSLLSRHTLFGKVRLAAWSKSLEYVHVIKISPLKTFNMAYSDRLPLSTKLCSVQIQHSENIVYMKTFPL